MASQLPLRYCLLAALALGYLLCAEAESIITEQQQFLSGQLDQISAHSSNKNPNISSVTNTEPQTSTTIKPTASPASTASPPPPVLQLIIQHAENPSGLLSNGQPCTNFAFAGQQCSLSFTYSVITGAPTEIIEERTASFGYGNSGENRDIKTIDYPKSSFNGFEISGTLEGDNGQEIAKFKYSIPSDQPKGIYTITDSKTGASVRFAWYTAIPVATTTVSPTTKQYESTAYTNTSPVTDNSTDISESTVATTTAAPFYPQDCDEITSRTDGVYTIYLGGDPKKKVEVYCEFGSTSGALTVIQSRGEVNYTGVEFSDNITQYKTPFGESGIGRNFWFGLDNMHSITNGNTSYNLYLEVCCGSTGFQQRYHNFSIGISPSYTLIASADVPGVGLGLVATGGIGKSDIGSQFSTRNTLNATGIHWYDCEVLEKTDDELNIIAQGRGGWWFGSCANNLNGQYIAKESTTWANGSMCLNGYKSGPNITGIELRATSGYANEAEKTYLDDKSYTRARMAIYRDDIPLQRISTSNFCSQGL